VGQETIDLISLYQCITPELAGGKRWQTKLQNQRVMHPLVKFDNCINNKQQHIYTSSVRNLQLMDCITETSKTLSKFMHLSGKVDIFWVTVSSDVHFLENVTLAIYGSNYTRNQI